VRAVLQRVRRARVCVDDREVGAIGPGLLALVAVTAGDGEEEVRWMAERLARYRVFADAAGRMNRSLLDCGGQCLLVSQFTLAADGRKGLRPSFEGAAEPTLAARLLAVLADQLRALGVPVACGEFGASMVVELVNEGPATFVLESPGAPPARPR
jgi:D-tyrosyl-tRNA(Tyr) deacylase